MKQGAILKLNHKKRTRHKNSQTDLSARFASTFYSAKLYGLLECCDKRELLEVIWALDRFLLDRKKGLPIGYSWPVDSIGATPEYEGFLGGWELETLANELFATKRVIGPSQLNVRNWESVRRLLNLLRKTENYQSYLPQPTYAPDMMTRILYRQARWQTNRTGSLPQLVRWLHILSEPSLNEYFLKRNGLTVRNFVLIGLAWNELFRDKTYTALPGAIEPLGITRQDVAAAANLLSAPSNDYQNYLVRRGPYNGEIAYREGPFRKWPVLSFSANGSQQFIRPISQLMDWRLSTGLYYDIVQYSEGPRLIGLAFEKYILKLTSEAYPSLDVRGELSYGSKKNPKKSPDILVFSNNKLILIIECKSTRANANIRLEMPKDASISDQIKELGKGEFQINRFHLDVLSNEISGVTPCDFVAKVVVSLDDWIFWGDSIKEKSHRHSENLQKAAKLSFNKIDSNVAYCNADQFEKLVSKYDFQTLIELLKRSFQPEWRKHLLLDVDEEYFGKKTKKFSYPLKNDFNTLLNLTPPHSPAHTPPVHRTAP